MGLGDKMAVGQDRDGEVMEGTGMGLGTEGTRMGTEGG